MKLRNLVIRGLMGAFPRSWRTEYGAELSGVLAQDPLTLGVVADVLGYGAKQRLYRDEPWKICGAALLLWTGVGLILSANTRVAPLIDSWCSPAPVPVLFAIGLWTVLRKNAGSWEAGLAAGKAAVVCFLPDVLTALLRGPTLLRHADGSVWHQWGLYFSTSQNISPWQYARPFLLIVSTGALLLGFAGALLGRFIVGLREELREA